MQHAKTRLFSPFGIYHKSNYIYRGIFLNQTDILFQCLFAFFFSDFPWLTRIALTNMHSFKLVQPRNMNNISKFMKDMNNISKFMKAKNIFFLNNNITQNLAF